MTPVIPPHLQPPLTFWSIFLPPSLLLTYHCKFLFYPQPRTCLLILERQGKGGRERGRETLISDRNIDQLPCTHFNWGLNLQARHVLWPGFEAFRFMWQCPTTWATTTRAPCKFLIKILFFILDFFCMRMGSFCCTACPFFTFRQLSMIAYRNLIH